MKCIRPVVLGKIFEEITNDAFTTAYGRSADEIKTGRFLQKQKHF